MRTLIVILILLSPLAAQTRSELDSKYGSIEGNFYRVKPGIGIEVTFYESGRVKTLRVVPDTSNGNQTLLHLDDVRKLITELVPGRLCHFPLRSTKIKVSCPPRKTCEGIEEEWKGGTTSLLVWHKKSIAYGLISLSEELRPPPGYIKLLPEYEHIPSCGIDTAAGYIRKIGGMEIHYDIGAMAGNFARRSANSDDVEWTRTEQFVDDSALIVLTKQKHMIATFEKAVANFTANVASKSDIDDFLRMVLTYKPRPTFVSPPK